MHPFSKHINPALGKRLQLLKMDKSFIKGEGCWLYDREGYQYLDFIAAYGALPFGHNPPEIWDSIDAMRKNMEPNFVQPSALEAASGLAEKLIQLAGEPFQYVTFTNSGAEAVEAAIKMARAATGKKGIISTNMGFHGKTMGALSATGREEYQAAFHLPVSDFFFVPYGDLEALEEALQTRKREIAAFIVEPIQGEGGVIQPPPGYLKKAKELCQKNDVLLISDEIQTGLGRSGYLFLSQKEDATPDIMTLAKALGGGLFPIGACLATRDVYTDAFGLKHSSTFAGNTMGCRVGLKVLELLTQNDQSLLKEIRQKGQYLKKGLETLSQSYPQIYKDVRGEGLLYGLEFGINRYKYPENLLGIMGSEGFLTMVLSGYLLNEEKLRVAPTLNGGSTIRLEPPLNISYEEIDIALKALERMSHSLSQKSTPHILGYLLEETHELLTPYHSSIPAREPIQPEPEDGRWAFLLHPLDLISYKDFDPSLSCLTTKHVRELTEKWSDIVDPFIVSEARITSETGASAFGEFIVLPYTSQQMMELPEKQVQKELEKACRMAQERGAKIVGLGAYTSVVSRGGLRLKRMGIPITTGNSYTVLSAMEALGYASEKLNQSLENTIASVVGGTGAIGRAISFLLAETTHRLYLIGNPNNPESAHRRLLKNCAQIYKHLLQLHTEGRQFPDNSIGNWLMHQHNLPEPHAPLSSFEHFAHTVAHNSPLTITTSCSQALLQSDIAVIATNSVGAFVTADMLKPGAIICDMSRPANVSQKVENERPDVLVIDGGIIEIPGRPNWGWNFGCDTGLAFACMSETFLLALEKQYESKSLGSDLNLSDISYFKQCAQKHGFKLAGLRSFDRPLKAEKWETLVEIWQPELTK